MPLGGWQGTVSSIPTRATRAPPPERAPARGVSKRFGALRPSRQPFSSPRRGRAVMSPTAPPAHSGQVHHRDYRPVPRVPFSRRRTAHPPYERIGRAGGAPIPRCCSATSRCGTTFFCLRGVSRGVCFLRPDASAPRAPPPRTARARAPYARGDATWLRFRRPAAAPRVGWRRRAPRRSCSTSRPRAFAPERRELVALPGRCPRISVYSEEHDLERAAGGGPLSR